MRKPLANHARIAVMDADCDRLHRLLAQIADAGHTAIGLGDASLAGTVLASTSYDLLLIAECPGHWEAGAFVRALGHQLGGAAPICVRMRPRSLISSASPLPPGTAVETVELPTTARALLELIASVLPQTPDRSGVFAEQPTQPELALPPELRVVC